MLWIGFQASLPHCVSVRLIGVEDLMNFRPASYLAKASVCGTSAMSSLGPFNYGNLACQKMRSLIRDSGVEIGSGMWFCLSWSNLSMAL